MKVVYCNHLPAKAFVAMTIWPLVIVRNDKKAKFTKTVERHEMTHAAQQKEMMIIFFYLLYAVEWIVKLPLCRFDSDRAYRSVSLEQEAYAHQYETVYNTTRLHFAFAKYIFTLKKL